MSIETENPSKSAYIDVEAMLAACVPGGSVADPQAIADAIRAWVAEQSAAQEPNHLEIPDSSVSIAEPATQEAVAVVTLSQRRDALGSRMSFVQLTDAAKGLPAGRHSLYTRPAEPAAVPFDRANASCGKCGEIIKFDELTGTTCACARRLQDAMYAKHLLAAREGQ